jgi:hypothetical protein
VFLRKDESQSFQREEANSNTGKRRYLQEWLDEVFVDDQSTYENETKEQ